MFPRLLAFVLELTKQSQTHLASPRQHGLGATSALDHGRHDAPWVTYMFSHLANIWAAMFDQCATRRIQGDVGSDPRVLRLVAIVRLIREQQKDFTASPFASWRVDRATMAKYLSRAATRRLRQLNEDRLNANEMLEIAKARTFERETLIATGTLSSTSEVTRTLQIALRRFVHDLDELLPTAERDHDWSSEALQNLKASLRTELGRFVDTLAQDAANERRKGS